MLNSLLASLPRATSARLISRLEPVELAFGDVLFQPGEEIRHAYFPNDCLVTLLAVVEGRTVLEVGLVGSEGMVGISLALGIGVSPVRALVQKSGTAMRIKSAAFRRELDRNPQLRKRLYSYTHALMAQATQTAVCSRFHPLEARLARLLLMTRDHVRANDFHFTHEFLAQMLGVRRVGVTKAAGTLQRRRLIRYSRGGISILDGTGLESASCRCYEIVKNAGVRARGIPSRKETRGTARALGERTWTTPMEQSSWLKTGM